ncbi:MAG: hypothetical protein KIS87_12935 [Phycisphaeraceae bacterium]|nr:hypothetical protein [Phycisphaeraceae bacterium]
MPRVHKVLTLRETCVLAVVACSPVETPATTAAVQRELMPEPVVDDLIALHQRGLLRQPLDANGRPRQRAWRLTDEGCAVLAESVEDAVDELDAMHRDGPGDMTGVKRRTASQLVETHQQRITAMRTALERYESVRPAHVDDDAVGEADDDVDDVPAPPPPRPRKARGASRRGPVPAKTPKPRSRGQAAEPADGALVPIEEE